jgi:antibiotic biosynthesis monooxygenase (ABM) superfamily enzyme
LTVIITRTIRAGSEQAFEDKAKALIRKALSVPSYLGVQIIRPQAGSPFTGEGAGGRGEVGV